jgi:arginine N-succinyltransferase
MTFLSVRPVRRSDLGALVEIAAGSGTGMTTVPSTPGAMAARIEASERAFAGSGPAPSRDVFFFVLDDGERAVGMASIFPALGEDRPFYSYRVSHIASHTPELAIRASTDVLHLVNDFHGYTEIGTLLVGEAARGGGAGRLLSLSRFAYLALHRERFGPKVMAEIRGWFRPDDTSPFWDAIASRFFHITFQEADERSAKDFRFIADLMPQYPIYVELLPQEAREVIGKPHDTSRYAMGMLEAEGFEWTRCVDIFDGGPSLECSLATIRTVRKARRLRVRIGDEVDEPRELVANPRAFASLIASGPVTQETVTLSGAQAERLGLAVDDEALVTPLRPARGGKA